MKIFFQYLKLGLKRRKSQFLVDIVYICGSSEKEKVFRRMEVALYE